MKKLVGIASVLGLVFSIAACGGEDKGYGDPIGGPSEQAAATAAVDQVKDLQQLAQTDGGDNNALGSVTGAFGNLSQLLNAKMVADLAGPGAPANQALQDRPSRLDAGCYTQDANGVEYRNCDTGGGTIDGHIFYDAENLDIDLTISMTAGAGSTSISMVGDLSITDTEIVGDLGYVVTVDQQGMAFEYAISANYDIGLTNGCATSGTMELHGNWSIDAQGQQQEYDVWVMAEYGPNCGDVVVR
jgi:hypothetical protein